ncbi:hypothetical protein TrVE_jg7256 [Triparma verrucosa]|uniref:Uncharacterized protein n=1 Tax=Triparma verrucosa TaxID=1606542 RepID=A0A9W7F1R1_9STRA|nr:hypothetical protein TrVE_jg7256 [Triparma verrucosa]
MRRPAHASPLSRAGSPHRRQSQRPEKNRKDISARRTMSVRSMMTDDKEIDNNRGTGVRRRDDGVNGGVNGAVNGETKRMAEGARNGTETNTALYNGGEDGGEARVIADAASMGGVGVGSDEISEPTPTERDAFAADFSAAFSMPASPLPFKLPPLSPAQIKALEGGERIQEQKNMRREGKGYVVMDVKASEDNVWDVLLDFASYPNNIPTVRTMTMFTNTRIKLPYTAESEVPPDFLNGKLAQLKYGLPSVTRAKFVLSKFRLNIAAIHKYRPHPKGHYMVFTLDPANTNMVLKSAKGVWHTQPTGRAGYTRVWLLCEVKVSRALPPFITDYAARRAMPRATQWLRPCVEAASQLWLREPGGEETREGEDDGGEKVEGYNEDQ